MNHNIIFRPLLNDGRTPLYRQLQQNLREAIHAQDAQTDLPLPTEREIATKLDISRVTVRKAFEELVAEGILERRQGAGTFIADRIQKDFAEISSFTEDMKARGLVPSSKWIVQEIAIASPDEAFNLGISPASKVMRLHRIRMANGEPLAVEYSTIPAIALNHQTHIEGSLYEALNAHGNRPVRALQRLRAIAFEGDIATQLGIEDGSAGLYIERRGFLRTGQIVELTYSYYRGDAYDFVSELDISQNTSTSHGVIS